MHVLVVDDLKEDRFVIKKLLQPTYTVTTLSSAREALAFASSHPFDVALLNVMLQEDLDGIQLLRNLRVITGPFLPIATTCHVDRVRCQRLLHAGFKAILPKPLDTAAFDALVHGHHQRALA